MGQPEIFLSFQRKCSVTAHTAPIPGCPPETKTFVNYHVAYYWREKNPEIDVEPNKTSKGEIVHPYQRMERNRVGQVLGDHPEGKMQ